MFATDPQQLTSMQHHEPLQAAKVRQFRPLATPETTSCARLTANSHPSAVAQGSHMVKKNSTAALFLRLQGRANGWVLRLVITGSSLSPAGTTDVQRRKTTAAARGDHQPTSPGRTGARPASALALLTASRLVIARSTRLADASRRTLPHQWSSRPTAHVQTLGRPSGTKSRYDGLTAQVLGLVRRPAPFGCRRCCNTNTSKITDL